MDNLIGELLGTMFLVIFGNGTVANVVLKKSKGESSGWIVITTGWFVGVMVGVFVCIAAGAPQGDINPAVTLAKWLVLGFYTAPEALSTMAVQLVGAFFGGLFVWLVYYQHFNITEDAGSILASFSTSPALNPWPEINSPANGFKS